MSKIKLPLQIAISIICLFWVILVLTRIDWSVTRDSFKGLSKGFLAASFFLFCMIYITRLFRLRYWVEKLASKRLTFKEWVDLYLKSIAFGSITPARLGDFSRIALLIKTGISLAGRSKIVFYDKMADFLYIPLGICLTSIIVGEKFNIPPVWILIGGLLSLAVYLLVAYLLVAFWFAGFLGIKSLLAGWVITIVGLCLFILSNSFLFRSVGIGLSTLDVAAITLSAGIIAGLPISVGGLGVREGSLIFLLGLWGIKPEATPPVLVLEFILNIAFPIMLYIIWISVVRIKRRLLST